MSFYKFLSISLFSAISIISQAQPIVSINDATVQITPSYTLNSGTSFSATGSVKNVSSYSITNTVHVHMAIDTSSTSTPKYHIRSTHTYSVTNFLPSQTFTFNVSDVASDANKYKVNGNGTTVVIWGVVGSPINDSTTYDSVKTSILVLPLPQNIHNLEFANTMLNNIPNPINQNIEFTNAENYLIELIDLHGKIMEIKNSKLETQNYYNGLYTLRFRDKQGNEVSKKIIISNE